MRKVIDNQEELARIVELKTRINEFANLAFEGLKRTDKPWELKHDLNEETSLRHRKIVVDTSRRDPVDDLFNYKAKIHNSLVEKACREICFEYQIDEQIIRDNIEIFDPLVLVETQKLSESFIDDFSDILPWASLLLSQDLSTEFLRKHEDKIKDNFEFQSLSEYEEQNTKSLTHDMGMEQDLVQEQPNAHDPQAEAERREAAERAVRDMEDQVRGLQKKIKTRLIIYRILLALVALAITLSIAGSILRVYEYYSGETEKGQQETVEKTKKDT